MLFILLYLYHMFYPIINLAKFKIWNINFGFKTDLIKSDIWNNLVLKIKFKINCKIYRILWLKQYVSIWFVNRNYWLDQQIFISDYWND